MIVQLDTENADRNLTSQVTCLTHTPDATYPMLCQAFLAFGDGIKNLDGTGGDFELTITVGGQTIQPDPQTITFSTAARSSVWSTVFPVPANAEVIVKVKSPNAGDSDVDVTAYLYDVSAVDAVAISGDMTAANNAESFFDGTGYAGTGNTIPTVTTLTNAPSDSSGVTTLLSRVVGTLDTGTHKPQSGDAYAVVTGASGNLVLLTALVTIDALLDKMAPLLIGTVTGAGTGTEVFVYGGVTATVTVDASGNVSSVVFS